MAYYDLTFFSFMKIVDGNVSTPGRQMAQLMSYVIIVSSLIVPMFLMFIVLRSHSLYEVKRYKERFSTILIKIDKTNYVHLFLPLFFFFRRFTQSMAMSLPEGHPLVFL